MDHQQLPSELARALLFALNRNADRPCFVKGDRNISYKQLNLYLLGFLLWLRRQDVSPGSAITFFVPEKIAASPVPKASVMCVVAGLAAMVGGYVMVENIMIESKQVRPQVALWDASAPPGESIIARLSDIKLLPIPQNWFESIKPDLHGITQKGLILDTIVRPSMPCLITQSSGTTGMPKIIPIMADVMLKRALRLVCYEPLPAGARFYLKAVSFTNHTVLHVLAILLGGGSFAITASQATFHLLTPARFKQLYDGGFYNLQGDLPIYDQVKIVGSAVNLPLLKKLRQVYRVIQGSYGSTEAGPTSACMIVDDLDMLHVGTPYPDLDVQIVDQTGRKVPDGQEGYIRIRSQTLIGGYIGRAELTQKAIRDGWFYPGDIGRYSLEGNLHIVGRDSEVFNLEGFKINAAIFDRILQGCPQTSDAIAFLESSEQANPSVAALVELTPGTAPGKALLAYEAVFAQHPNLFPLRPRTYYFCDSIPRNANGKPMRRQASQLAQELTPVFAAV